MQSYASSEGNDILGNSEDTFEIIFLFESKLKETQSYLSEFGYRLITRNFRDPAFEHSSNLRKIILNSCDNVLFFVINGIGIGIGINNSDSDNDNGSSDERLGPQKFGLVRGFGTRGMAQQ